MPTFKKVKKLVVLCLFLFLTNINHVFSQEINWYSSDEGGGISIANNLKLVGVIGQIDTTRMEGGSITIAGGFLPLPADLLFENTFE